MVVILGWGVIQLPTSALSSPVDLGTNIQRREHLFLPGFEPGTFRVLDECDNHYTTETHAIERLYSSQRR